MMELDELKASWNAFDKRLAETEIVNMRMVKEMVTQKTKTAFDGVVGHNIYSFVVTLLMMAVVFPYVYMNTPITTVSFVIVEGVMLIGLGIVIWKLCLLSKIDLGAKKANELSGIVLRYKKICHNETSWSIALVAFAMVAFYISELGFNNAAGYVLGTRIWLVVGLTLLTFALAFAIGLWQRRRHAQQMAEIERGLEELTEVEN